MARTRLTRDQQRYIVRALACYERPAEVQRELQLRWGITLPLNAITRYDASRAEGQRTLGAQWQKLFAVTRLQALHDIFAEPAAHRPFRVRRLARMARDAESRRDMRLAADLYLQIAEEMGALFTVSRQMNGLIPEPALEQLLGLDEAEMLALLTAPSGTPATGPSQRRSAKPSARAAAHASRQTSPRRRPG